MSQNTLNQIENNVEDQDDDEFIPTHTPVVKQEQYTKALGKELGKLPSKSAQIRFLNKKGYTTGDITRIMSAHWKKEVKYQHVRNILLTPTKSK